MSSLRLILTPRLDCEPADQSIHVRMVLPITSKAKDDILFHHVLARGPIKTQQFSTDAVTIHDASGSVPVHCADSKDGRRRVFHAGRDLATGELAIEYTAAPWDATEASPCGPQIALERDGGGLTAAGMSFILRPNTNAVLDTTIEWDLSSAPPGTRAVCSLGEGVRVTAQVKAADIDECFFAVGPLHSYPAGETGGPFGTYWLSSPPFDAAALGAKMEALFPKMAGFFTDADPTYRIFIRRNVQKCVSGRGLHRGFVFAWTSIAPRDSSEIDEFLMHETVHNWPRLGHSPDGPTLEEMADGWWNEGIAEYYSLFLPFRFGIFPEHDFVDRLNIHISGYYTNPDRDVKNKDIQRRFWAGGHVNRIPYQRGLMYFMLLAYQLNKAGGRSLDQLVLEMLNLRRREQPHGIAVWNAMLEKELGPSAETGYRDMSEAVPIVLPPDCLRVIEGLDWTLERQDQEEFHLGFDEDSLSRGGGVIKDLDPSSRAAEAGVREGDVVTPSYSFFFVADRWGQDFNITVKRGGSDGVDEVKVLSWWPRSRSKVESYQFVQS
jgi:predicted metalloprotease with PDZ domain